MTFCQFSHVYVLLVTQNTTAITMFVEPEEEEKEHKEGGKQLPFYNTHHNDFNLANHQQISIAFTLANSFLITSYHSLPEAPPPNFS